MDTFSSWQDFGVSVRHLGNQSVQENNNNHEEEHQIEDNTQ